MAEAGEVAWKSEEIPDPDLLYLRVHFQNIRGEDLIPAAFQPRDGGVSTNWSKYADPETTRQQIALHPINGKFRDPKNYAVAGFQSGSVRQVPSVEVKHTPRPENRAHTDITFDLASEEEFRVKLSRIPFRWFIKLETTRN